MLAFAVFMCMLTSGEIKCSATSQPPYETPEECLEHLPTPDKKATAFECRLVKSSWEVQ